VRRCDLWVSGLKMVAAGPDGWLSTIFDLVVILDAISRPLRRSPRARGWPSTEARFT